MQVEQCVLQCITHVIQTHYTHIMYVWQSIKLFEFKKNTCTLQEHIPGILYLIQVYIPYSIRLIYIIYLFMQKKDVHTNSFSLSVFKPKRAPQAFIEHMF